MDEYLKAGMVCDPLSRYDCVPPVAGASCVIVSTADRCPPHRKPVRVRALKQSFNYDNQEGPGLQTGLTKGGGRSVGCRRRGSQGTSILPRSTTTTPPWCWRSSTTSD